jgi:hypothetical protein
LTAGRPGEELAERNEVREGGVIDPAAPYDDLLAKIADMSRGTTKGREPQLEEYPEYFEPRAE